MVTGASAGIGTAIARELAKRGHGLILVARRKDKLDELAAQLTEEFGVRADTLGCDLGKAASRQRLPARVQSLGLTVSVLVNNAGFATGGAFYQSDPTRELDQVRVLVEAPMALCSAFLPEMVRRGSGAVLNVASTAGMQPLPYSAGYSAAKAYMLTFSEALHQARLGDRRAGGQRRRQGPGGRTPGRRTRGPGARRHAGQPVPPSCGQAARDRVGDATPLSAAAAAEEPDQLLDYLLWRVLGDEV
jgi:NAD(P)-dependent dehydrogenase (short-subunit alcohol dehydrogenase family)